MGKAKVTGLDDWLDWTNQVPKAIEQAVENQVNQSGNKVLSSAKLLAPVDTGELRGSINTRSKHTGTKKSVEVFSDVEHARPVEYGTWKTRAQPYLIPSFNKEVANFQRQVEQAYKKGLK